LKPMTTRRRVGEQIGRLSYSPRSPSMRFETHDSASMLFRHVDIVTRCACRQLIFRP